MINLAASDLELFDQAIGVLVVPIAPIHAFFTGLALYFYIGLIGIFCAIAMVILSILSICLSQISKRMRGKIGELSDRRIKLLNDFLYGVRILKLYGWDKSYIEIIKNLRKKEIRKQSWRFVVRYLILSLMFSLTGIVVMIIFLLNFEIGN